MQSLPMEAFSMIGKTISHYRTIYKLGQSGVGVIYSPRTSSLSAPSLWSSSLKAYRNIGARWSDST